MDIDNASFSQLLQQTRRPIVATAVLRDLIQTAIADRSVGGPGFAFERPQLVAAVRDSLRDRYAERHAGHEAWKAEVHSWSDAYEARCRERGLVLDPNPFPRDRDYPHKRLGLMAIELVGKRLVDIDSPGVTEEELKIALAFSGWLWSLCSGLVGDPLAQSVTHALADLERVGLISRSYEHKLKGYRGKKPFRGCFLIVDFAPPLAELIEARRRAREALQDRRDELALEQGLDADRLARLLERTKPTPTP